MPPTQPAESKPPTLALATADGSSDMIGYAAAACMLGTPLSTLYSMVARRQLPHFRYGPRHVRFSREALRSWMAQRAITTGAK